MNLPQQRERVTVDGLGNIGVGRYKTTVPKMSTTSNNSPVPVPGKLIDPKQLEEFTNNMRSLGIEINGFESYRGNSEMLRSIFTEYSKLAEIFPEEFKNLKLSYTMDPDITTFGWYERELRTIHLNKALFDDTEYARLSYLESVRTGHFPKGTTVESIFYHEFGHHFQSEHNINCLQIAKDVYKQRIGGYMSVGRMKSMLRGELSIYAAKDTAPQFQEVIAECFSSWYNSNSKSEFAKMFLEKVGALR